MEFLLSGDIRFAAILKKSPGNRRSVIGVSNSKQMILDINTLVK